MLWTASSTPIFSSGTWAHGIQTRDYHKLTTFSCLGGFHAALHSLLQSPKLFLQHSNVLKQAAKLGMVNLVGAVACCIIHLCLSSTTRYLCLCLQWCSMFPHWPQLIPRCCALMVSSMSWSITGSREMGYSSKGCLFEIKWLNLSQMCQCHRRITDCSTDVNLQLCYFFFPSSCRL